jgi:hypothetical protein
MQSLYLIGLLGAAFILTAGGFLIHWRRRKNRLIRLRLTRGRSHLLSDQIQSQVAALDSLEATPLEHSEEEANSILDQMQIALVERQAHLQTYADLAHLQMVKIDLLTQERRRVLHQPPDAPAVQTAQASSSPQPLTPPDRDELENLIKAQIEALKSPRKKRDRD